METRSIEGKSRWKAASREADVVGLVDGEDLGEGMDLGENGLGRELTCARMDLGKKDWGENGLGRVFEGVVEEMVEKVILTNHHTAFVMGFEAATRYAKQIEFERAEQERKRKLEHPEPKEGGNKKARRNA
ncbi:MAG: hypothetical protein Q9160_007922, partial [Pyrenula sp. 1 TL-2023]